MPRPRQFDEQVVVERALQTFWSGSYAATSTDDLCASTGLSRSSLYNTFHGKNEMYRLCLATYCEAKDTQRRAYLDRPGTGREILAALLTDLLAAQSAEPGRRCCLVINAAVEVGTADEEVATVARQSLTAFRDLLREIVTRGQQDGSLDAAHSPESLAGVIQAALNGLQVTARITDHPDDIGQSVSTLLELLHP